jgi:hypothetical protein
VSDDDLNWMHGRWIAPPDLARLVEEFDRVVSV